MQKPDNPAVRDRPRMWKLRQAADRPGVLQLYVYGYVEPDYWWADESTTSAEYFRRALAEYPNATEIEIYINSLGGDVVEGTAIYNQLRRHPAHKTVYVDGFAGSIASVIAMLEALGGKAVEEGADIIVCGADETGGLTGGTVSSFGDHRIVMAAAVAALRCTGDVTITGAEAVRKSYPSFFEEYTALGGIVHVI